MRFSFTFVIPLVVLVSTGARAQDAARPDPGAPPAPAIVDPMAVDPLDPVTNDGLSGEQFTAEASAAQLLRIDSAREALLLGDSLTAARELRQASSLLRLDAGRLDARGRMPLLEVASRLATVANDVELGYVDQASFDRELSSALRSLAGHHLALASEGDGATTARHLRLAADAFERAYNWRLADDGDVHPGVDRRVADTIDATRALAQRIAANDASKDEIDRGIARLGRALDDEIARAGRGEPAKSQ